ncbi:MAG: Bax inhibitor-1 family protein [Peptostreptococcaceae bacterium]
MKKVSKNPMADVFKYLAISIVFMFLGVLFGKTFIPKEFIYYANMILIFLFLGIMILALFSRKGIIPDRFPMYRVYIFTFIDGILMYPVIQSFILDLGVSVVLEVLIVTSLILMALSYIAKNKPNDYYSGWWRPLIFSLLGLLVFAIVSLFLGTSFINIIVCVIGIVIFSGWILYDVNSLKSEIDRGNIVYKDDLSSYVLDIYLDFINIFIDLLSIVWEMKD